MTENHVYQAIAAITDEMSREGITKNRKNQQQGYAFRGIDDVLNALSPMLAKHKLNILPRVTERICVERATQRGSVLFCVTVKSEFDFVSAVDGSKHTVTTYGEAMDSADKATNKAMSAAYKYAAFQAFCIPTEGDNDADATTHEVASEQKRPDPITPARVDFIIKTINEAKDSEIVKKLNHDAKQECMDAQDEAAYSKIIAIAKTKLNQLKGENNVVTQ